LLAVNNHVKDLPEMRAIEGIGNQQLSRNITQECSMGENYSCSGLFLQNGARDFAPAAKVDQKHSPGKAIGF
jgi:hypothetical protein